MSQVGVVLFDSETEPEAGWACIAGEKYAKRIRSLSNLRSDVVWMMNLGFVAAGTINIRNHSFLRGDTFLGIKLSDLIGEMGILNGRQYNGKTIETPIQAKLLADLFDRCVNIQCSILGMSRKQLGLARFDFRESFREVLYQQDLECDPLLYEASEVARHLPWTSVYTRFQSEETQYTRFYLPRIQHAIKMLSLPVPTSSEVTVVRSLPANRRDFGDWMRTLETPILARVIVHDIDDRYASIISHGNGSRTDTLQKGRMVRSRVSQRDWLTTYDLVQLEGYADVEIKEAIMFDPLSMKSPRQIIPRIDQYIQSLTDAESISYSMGIVTYGIWTGLQKRLSSILKRNVSSNLWAPLMGAYDRLLCLEKAGHMVDAGHTVVGYGSGKVHARMSGNIETDVINVCRSTGLLPFMFDAATSSDNAQIFMNDTHDPWGVSMLMLSSGMIDDYLSADQEITNSWIKDFK